jgi:hypothetical protein
MSHHAMRLLLPATLIAAGLLSLGNVHAAGAAGGGLVAAYSFDEGSGTTAADLSGNGNTATLTGVTFASGKYGSAVSLNGTSSLVTIPDSASLDLSSGMTLEAWVRATSFASSQTLVAKERPGGGFPYGVELDNGVPAGYARTSSFTSATGTAALPTATWKYVAVTYDGSALRAYVDGTQVGTAPASGSIASSSGQLSIGGDSVWGEYFNGRVDNVRIYDRALSSSELAADRTTPVAVAAPPPPTPVAAYAFDEGTGMTAADSSGSGNAATLNGATWTASGKYGAAASFGATSIVTAADAPSLDPTAGLTLEAWVKPTSFAASQTIVAKERPGGGFPWGVELDNGIPSAYVTTGSNAVATAPSALPLGSWSFVAATYDGTTLAVSVNGSVVASTAVSGALATSNGTLSIGADAAWGEHFAGSIDNVRVYGTALSSSQLGTDMSTAIGGSAPPPPPADTTPPSPPGGFATSNVSQTGLTLAWTASTDNVGVTGYDVYAGGLKAGTVSTTSYALTGLSCGTTYTFGVDAHDAAGNTSAAGTVTAQTSACSTGGTGFVKYACTGRSFYVDYAAGSDAAGGNSTAAAWKRAPGMNGFAGSYAHQAHDCFYFKGGVTWPNAAFPLVVPGGGDTSADTYYGADPAWYAGSSWTRPVFDLGDQFVAGAYDTVVDFRSADRTTFDNIEVKNWKTRGWGGGYSSCAAFWVQGVHHVTLQHVYFHGWDAAGGDTNCVAVQADTYGAYGGQTRILSSRFIGNGAGEMTKCINVVKDSEFAFAEGFLFPCVGSQGDGSGAVGELSGNLLHDCGYPWPAPNSGVHGDVIQADKNNSGGDTSAGTLSIHDNVIYDTGRDSTNECESMLIGNPGETDYVWNNVVYNLQGNGIGFPQDGGYARGTAMYVWNNTLVGGGSAGSFSYGSTCVSGSGSWSAVVIQNNYCVANAAAFNAPSGAVVDHNVVRTKAQADTDRMTASTTPYAFYPTAGAPTIGVGVNLTSSCTGVAARLCADTTYAGTRTTHARTASGAWDVGAYSYG